MITKLLAGFIIVLGFVLVPVVTQAAAPIDPFGACTAGVTTNSDICNAAAGSDSLFGPGGIWNRILNTITFVIGAIAVLMIIIGAVRYGLSGGDQSQVTSAKNTIIYAVISLIVAVMASAIVNFVLTNI